jgi:hypothetical protein
MNTDTIHQLSDTSNNVESAVRPTTHTPKIRHRIVAFVAAALLLATGFGAASAAPASAAPVPAYGTASVCFKVPTAYGWLTYDRPVMVDAYVNGTWQQVGGVVYPDRNGCIRQALSAGYYWHYRVYYYERGAGTYVGTSNYAFVNAGGSYNLGTVYLARI